MANSGPSGEWAAGLWALKLPVASVVAFCFDGSDTPRMHFDDWGGVTDDVLAVLVIHPNGYKTWMTHVDEYPDPRGVGPTRLGAQVGEVGCPRWLDMISEIRQVGAEL